MDTKELINSGNLELYVYGLLSESENEEILQKQNSTLIKKPKNLIKNNSNKINEKFFKTSS